MLIDGLTKMGWNVLKPGGSMFVWAPIPEPYSEMDSVELCSMIVRDCNVALSPGLGFGPGGEGYVRFALIENEKRIQQGLPQPARPDQVGLTAPAVHVPETSPPVVSTGAHGRLRRVWLPDRPGALGQVASRIGSVRGDVLGIEILESGGGRVVDELVVGLPDAGLVDLLIAEVSAVDGVSVEHVRPIEGDRVDPDLAALASGAELAEAEPADRLAVLCAAVARVADAEWAAVIRDGVVVHSSGQPPELPWLLHVPRRKPAPPRRGTSAPSDLVWARLPRSGVSVAAGRSDRTVRERERTHVALLARVADALEG